MYIMAFIGIVAVALLVTFLVAYAGYTLIEWLADRDNDKWLD